MRLAIPMEDGRVAHHLGHCPHYMIAEVEAGEVRATAPVPNPRHGPGGPPPLFLARLGITHVVGWGAPTHVVDWLGQLGMQVTLGIQGEVSQVVADFVAGRLTASTEDTELSCGGCGDH